MWVDRWRAVAADKFDVEPSQTAGARFPEIPPAAFERAVQLVEIDGRVFPAAHAVLRARKLATGRSWLLDGYERLPGFAPATEMVYRLVAGHRPLLSRLTRVLWGGDVRKSAFGASTWIFLRLLGVVHLIAFVSFWTQLNGLIGSRGVLPAQMFFDAVRDEIGAARFWELPTLCWIFGGGWFLHVLCLVGVVLSIALTTGRAPAVSLAGLWVCYLSLCAAGQMFMNFQWDALLLETTLLAIFVAPWSFYGWRVRADPPRLARWLLWWLLFRLMFLSGVVKLTSGDPAWTNLTALTFHYETQPLPTWIGWYFHQLPGWFHRLSCAVMFAIELAVPFLLFLPRRARHTAAAIQVALQGLIALTGNYTFFNLLTVALCLVFFDDAFWQRFTGYFAARPETPAAIRFCPRPVLLPAASLTLLLTFFVTAVTIFPRAAGPAAAQARLEILAPLRTFNSYGLFRVMTRERPEIIIEGSNDGRTWLPYEFKAKPGDPSRRPRFVAPHQPRLDWQLWFAALAYPRRDPWVGNLCVRLLEGSRPVAALFARNPFPDKPPRQIRAVLYDYHFTNRATRAATGRWWRRTPSEYYYPTFTLR
ncbi:MAG: hypothetical protein A3G75_06745 [Verrucomicrobia bacterium RIFCSPLOWO2_12_FULL_64_8]|nr:MAG: hypothetical protein A3G75_06745 [Verrucomicrobia bacterium RIFCSPLOWO2_12_FULL_64_8]